MKLLCEAALAVARDVVAANRQLHDALSAELTREERVEGAVLQVGVHGRRSQSPKKNKISNSLWNCVDGGHAWGSGRARLPAGTVRELSASTAAREALPAS